MRKKIGPGIFDICKYAFSNISKKVWAKELSQVFSDSQVCLFEYLKNGMSKKIEPGIFRFVSILLQIFETGYEQKHCSR